MEGPTEFSRVPHVYLPAGVETSSGLERWEFETQALADFDALKRADLEAFLEISQLLERWGKRGARNRDPDLVAPSGKHVLRSIKDPPWLGEVKGHETPSAKRKSALGMAAQYRLYFMDISQRMGYPEFEMLIVLCKEKRLFGTTKADERKAIQAQDRDIRLAMCIGKRWCADNGVQYRPWPDC